MPVGDGHRDCFRCLGLQHARAAVADPMRCQACDLLGDRLRAARLAAMEDVDPSPDDDYIPPSGTVRLDRSASEGVGDGEQGPAEGGDLLAGDPPAAKRPRVELLNSLELRNAQHLRKEVLALDLDEDDEEGEDGDDDGVIDINAPDDPDLVESASTCEAEPSVAGSEEPCTAAESMRFLLERVTSALDMDVTDPDDVQAKIPMCPKFAAAFRESWNRMGRTGAQARFRPSRESAPWTRMSDQESVGIAAYPAMDNVVAATFLSDAEIIGGKGPQLRIPDDRAADQYLNRTFNVLAIMARLNNAAMLLGAYLEHLVPHLHSEEQGWTDEAVEVSRLLGVLQSELVRANGQAMASVVDSRRRLWLARCGLEPTMRKSFSELPFTPGFTFGAGVDDILRRTETLRRDRDTIGVFQGPSQPRAKSAPKRSWSQAKRGLSAGLQRRLGPAPRQPQAQSRQFQAPPRQFQAQPQGQWQGNRGRGRQRRQNRGRGGPSAGRGRFSGNPGPQQST